MSEIRELNINKIRFNASVIKNMETQIEHIIFERQENHILHNTFEWAEELFLYVFKADQQGLEERCKEGISITGTSGVLASDRLRSIKNQGICLIATLTYKIIEQKHLDAENAYSVSDACIQMIERSQNVEEVIEYICSGLFIFISHIQNQEKSYHHLVRKTKEYIFKNFHEKIVISEIADNLATNPSYLSRIFK